MLKHLSHLLLGTLAGLLVGIVPSFIVGLLSGGAYGIGVLTSCVLLGAIMGVMQREKIEIFLDGLFELITLGGWS